MRKAVKVMLVDDSRLFREAVKMMISYRDDLEVVAEATDGIEAFRLFQRKKPDLILLDLTMPKMDGLEVIRDVKRLRPEALVLVLSIHESYEYVLAVFKAGADGYCIKNTGKQELELAIDCVLSGKNYICAGITQTVLDGSMVDRECRVEPETDSKWTSISGRERQVLKLIAEGYKNKEISGFLNISVKTVAKHRANIMKKLDLHNAAHLAAYAALKGLVSTD